MPKQISLEHLPRGVKILAHDTFGLDSNPENDQIRINRFSRLGAICTVHHGVIFDDPEGRKTRLTQPEDAILVLGMAGLGIEQTVGTLGYTENTVIKTRRDAYAKLGVTHMRAAMAPATRRLVEVGLVRFSKPIKLPEDMPDLQQDLPYFEGFSRGRTLEELRDEGYPVPSGEPTPVNTIKNRVRRAYDTVNEVINPRTGAINSQQDITFFTIGSGLVQVETPYGPAVPQPMVPPRNPHA